MTNPNALDGTTPADRTSQHAPENTVGDTAGNATVASVPVPSASAPSPAPQNGTRTIREVARMFHLQPSTLRYYEEQGLLTNVDRDTTGQRIYHQGHVNRLKSICCFKHAGMSIEELKRFFTYEDNEAEHIDEMVNLVNERRAAIEKQLAATQDAYAHILRKQHFYADIQKALREGTPHPDWNDYRDAVFTN